MKKSISGISEKKKHLTFHHHFRWPTGGKGRYNLPRGPAGLSHPTNIQTQGPLQRQTEPNRRKLGGELCKNHLGMDLF